MLVIIESYKEETCLPVVISIDGYDTENLPYIPESVTEWKRLWCGDLKERHLGQASMRSSTNRAR